MKTTLLKKNWLFWSVRANLRGKNLFYQLLHKFFENIWILKIIERVHSILPSGIAFPCCISVNNTICHFSPLQSEPDYSLLDGDMVKLDMGAHIDGFIAVVAHTVVISDEKTKITGRKADTILAAHLASEAALRLVKPGNEVG